MKEKRWPEIVFDPNTIYVNFIVKVKIDEVFLGISRYAEVKIK